ncbi:MAG: hypothetical protein H0Z32_05320 [Bacillaceae bacterium]|nr:hypothetical protein [Bacillaceae bacterium]
MEEVAFPGLTDSMEWMEVRTPQDAYHFGLYQGGMFGIEPSLFQSGVFRPQVKPLSVDNLYAVGASIHPGGGIPIVIQGAQLMVRQLVQDFQITSASTTARST